MDRSLVLFLQALFLVAALSGSEALRCYTCSSDNEQRCADPMDKSLLPQDCNIDAVKRTARVLGSILGTAQNLGVDAFGERYTQYGGGQPTSVCQKLDLMVRNQNVTIRGCAILPNDEQEDHCRRVSTQMQSETVQNVFCGTCQAEGCNGASSLTGILALLLPASLAALLAQRA